MVPGKRYAPEDFLKIAWRRKWFIIVPLVVAAAGSLVYSRSLPNRYRSEALVLIIPQQIPEKFIRPTVDETIKARLDLMRQQILSRARLESIINEFNLYPEERKVLLTDQIVERMRDDIGVDVQKAGRRQDPNHFIVSYDSEDPQMAMQVAARLASLFVRENIEGRSIQTDTTTQFLQSQVDEARRQLQEQEARLESFRRTHAGRLPSEVGTNLQLMSHTSQQIQTLNDEINRDRERQIALERMISDELTLIPAIPAVASGNGSPGEAALPASQQLAAARANLQSLLTRFTPDHPDIRILNGRIKELEVKAEAEALQQPLNGGVSIALTAAEAQRQKRLSQLRGELQSLERDIKAKQTAIRTAQQVLAQHEQRVQSAPGLESQLSEMMRGYESLRANHEGLLRNLQDAKLAGSLEQRQVSQQFRIVDPARRPDRPHSPNRVRMNLIGSLLGLGFGLAIAGLLEYRDTSLRTADDVLVALSLPVVALVPTMRARVDERARRRRRLVLLASSAAAMLIVGLVAVIWKLRLLDSWSR